MTFLRTAAFIAVLGATPFLSGCSSINSWLADVMADHIPAWAGGLPPGAPPRSTDPRYAEYEQTVHGGALIDANKSTNKTPDAAAPLH